MSEILTLQFGHYSNFVATHWWNLQESNFSYTSGPTIPKKEINHDILFREGQNLAGEVTYTPRLVACDLKGSLNTLRQEGKLYDISENEEEDIRWESDVTLHKVEQARKNRFLIDLDRDEVVPGNDPSASHAHGPVSAHEDEKEQAALMPAAEHGPVVERSVESFSLDDSISVWSDFLRPHFHPRSICVVNKYKHESELEPFNVFGYGLDVHHDHNWHALFEDKLHFFLEECDNIQGFHIMVDTHDAFGGLASASIEELTEDYGTKGLMVFAATPSPIVRLTARQNDHRLLNSLLSFEKLYTHASAMIPISLNDNVWKMAVQPRIFPHLNYKSDLNYHTSAILAATLDTVTMPYRVPNAPALITHMTQALTPLGRKILCLQSSLPFPLHLGSTLVDSLTKYQKTVPWQSLTPYCPASAVPDGQSVVMRGISSKQVAGDCKPNMPRGYGKCDSVEELLQMYLTETTSTSLNAVCHLQQPLKTSTPFPHIFKQEVAACGLLHGENRLSSLAVDSVPVFSSLQSTAAAGNVLEALLNESSKLNIRKYHNFLESGLELDEYIEARESVQTMLDGYRHEAGNMA